MLTDKEIREQSMNAYKQWCVQWRKQATYHSKYPMKSFKDFENIGMGKAILCVANGYSFEREIETIKKLQHKVDIMCCDKTLGQLIENNIFPTYCMVCDANVPYESYMKPWEDKLDKTIMFNCVTGNPAWTDNGNWKDRYFYVNKDILKSEEEFSKLSGCYNQIPAATNVSNAMVVLLTQCDYNIRKIFFGYDKILLVGYDYSWKANGSYYAFDKTGGGKGNYMRHAAFYDPTEGDWSYTSNNLHFSSRWMSDYIKVYNLPVVQCSKGSILQLKWSGELERQMDYEYNLTDGQTLKEVDKELNDHRNRIRILEGQKKKIGIDHHNSFLASLG